MTIAVWSRYASPMSLLILTILLQLIHYTDAQCEVHSCATNQFCIVQSSVVRCDACDLSCNGCTSAGSSGCDKCNPGYKLFDGYCKACPDFTFGINCFGICHCATNNPRCRNEDGYCYSFECAQGYEEPPMCQNECDEGLFHTNCDLTCHCPEGDKCDKVNGACSSNKCHAEYGGSACQIHLPRLFNAPAVTDISCNGAMVSWPVWQEGEDIGGEQKMIARYDLYMNLKNSSTGWQLMRSIQHRNTTSTFSVSLTNLEDEAEYMFRVDVRRYTEGDLDKLMPAIGGVPTDYILISCQDASTSTPTERPNLVSSTTSTIVIDSFLIDTVEMVIYDNNTITVTWSLLNSTTDNNISMSLQYTETWIGDCKKLIDENTTEVTMANTGSFHLNVVLSPWRQYTVKVIARSEEQNIIDTRQKDITTKETAPTGIITNVTVWDLTSDRIRISWSMPLCEERGGAIWKYHVFVQTINDSASDKTTTVKHPPLTINQLQPYTNYAVTVRFVTEIGESNYSDRIEFTTNEDVPDAPEITKIIASEKTLTVTVSPPNTTNGVLTKYMTSVSTDDVFSNPVSVEYATNTSMFVVKNLSAYTVYFVKVRVRTRAGWGNYSDIVEYWTEQDYPDEPAKISSTPTFKNETCLEISWSEPDSKNGIIYGYQIVYYLMSEPENKNVIVVNITVNLTQMVCSLSAGQRYAFSVAARTARGYGRFLSSHFFTELGSPLAPPSPTFVKATYTTIIINLNPVVLNTGPLTAYHVLVEDVMNSERKKRALSNITLSNSTEESISGYVTAMFPGETIVKQLTFTVGDNKQYGSYTNVPLKREHSYNIYYKVISTLEGTTKSSISMMNGPIKTVITPETLAQTSETEVNGIVVGVLIVFILLVVALLVLVAIWWYRKKNPSNYIPYFNEKPNFTFSFHEERHDPEKYWSKIYSLSQSRHITAGKSDDKKPMVTNGTVFSDDRAPHVSFIQEFSNLPHNQQATEDAAYDRRNIHKNRFPHLLAYDHSRVVLRADENSTSDYINASFIDGYKASSYYIAAQSPFDAETVLDFWRMIYQYNIETVVMMGNLIEDSIVKCTQYWPEKKIAKYRSFVIENVDIQGFADFVIRIIRIRNEGEAKGQLVHIFEYVSWPEHGVPKDALPLLQMRHKVRENHQKSSSPLLVHCGTGVSRSATYITIDSLIEQYKGEGNVSVFAFVRKMRKDRIAMVRTQKQYIFIYEAVFDACILKNGRLGLNLKNKYHALLKKDPQTGHTRLKEQFIAVQKYNRKILSSECLTALLAGNQDRNRFQEIIPPDEFRPLLFSTDIEKNNYINAVFIDSHRKQNYFIVTQTPLHTTISEFWKLVYDHNVNTIVMMENFRNEDDTCAEYWPIDRMHQYEPFFIEPTSVSQDENITIRQFQLWNRDSAKDKRTVRQFQFNAWSDTEFVPKSKSMVLDLLELVHEWQCATNGDRSPVIIHCKDGATHSGMFCAVHIICESMKDDKNVDITQVVRHLKRRRVQIIDVLDQYRFCHKILWDYMNLRMPGGALTDRMMASKGDVNFGRNSLNLTSQSTYNKFV